jgi:hypothetical protein
MSSPGAPAPEITPPLVCVPTVPKGVPKRAVGTRSDRAEKRAAGMRADRAKRRAEKRAVGMRADRAKRRADKRAGDRVKSDNIDVKSST